MQDEAQTETIACPHAPLCPGCAGIGRSLAEQLVEKAERVGAALAPYRALRAIEPAAIQAAPSQVAYRTRAKLVVAPGPRIGLYARGGHEALDLPQCRVQAPATAAAIAALRALVADPPDRAAPVLRPEGEGPGRLRALDLREVVDESGAGVLLTLVLRAPAPPRAALDAACDALDRAIPALRGIALSLHDGRSPQLLGAAPLLLRGAPLVRDFVRRDAPYALAAPGSFAQANRAQAARIHAAIEHAIPAAGGARVLDLFAGSGALGLAMAARGARVTMVEAFAHAIEAASQAAREQGLADRVRTRAESAEDAAEQLLAARERFDAAIVNPPRRGLSPRLRESLARLVRGTIVYVSCEPATLARDLAHLADLGWRTAALTPFDMMPLTAEVECLALLARAEPPALVVLHDEGDLIAVEKPPFLPTVPHPERRGSLLERVRALPGAAHAVPLHRLDADTSGVCLFARSGDAAPAWQKALAADATAKRYLALVRGVGRAKGRVARPLREDGRTLDAATRYRRIEVVHGHALLEVTLETGRTHQIRRHLASIGQPVLGDARHGHAASNRHLFERFHLDRPFLHCASIELAHPQRSAPLRIESPLAPDLAAVLERLRAPEIDPRRTGSAS
jgi:23S rRNA (uracil1939-C5)-methyltransferase